MTLGEWKHTQPKKAYSSLKARNSWKTTSAIEKMTIIEEVVSDTGENLWEQNYWPQMILYSGTKCSKGNWLNQSQSISCPWPCMCTARGLPHTSTCLHIACLWSWYLTGLWALLPWIIHPRVASLCPLSSKYQHMYLFYDSLTCTSLWLRLG